jgi:putative transposase
MRGAMAGLLRVGEDETLSMAIRRAETLGRPLGDDALMAHIEAMSGRDVHAGKHGPKKKDN